MYSTFASLNTALSGLLAQRYSLDVTGQNIANVNTPGYNRQRANLSAVNPAAAASLHSRWDGPGTGVEVVDVERLADVFVDARARAEHEAGARLAVADQALTRVDALLLEPTDQGLTAQLTRFFDSWTDLANRPDADSSRVAVIEAGNAVADRLFRLGEDVANQWNQRFEGLSSVVTDVNAASSSIAELNRAIQQASVAGVSANELIDRRNVLVDDLVALTGGTVRAGTDNMVDVYVNGMAAVRGITADTLNLDLSSATTLAGVRAGGTVAFQWSGGVPARIPGGTLAGLVDVLTVTLPGVADSFDAVAADLATQVNTLHLTGKGLDNVSGRPFFSGTTTATLAVSVTSQQVAAAAYDALNPTAAPFDASIADAIALLGEARTGPASTWRSTVTVIGSDAAAAKRRNDVQAVAIREADRARQGVSGVDTDEELTNMIRFQRAYEGTARMLTAVDETLDVLINRTGLVGR